MNLIYDIEVFPNCFLLAAEHSEYPLAWAFEISNNRDDTKPLMEWLYWLKEQGATLVGFNNVGFDYPVLHTLIQTGHGNPNALFDKAQAIIQSEDRFAHIVRDCFIPQLDLFKIHHFDNLGKSTSLKVLEFNMRMHNIKDLPFPVGSTLTLEQIKVLKLYNAHDVVSTKRFYHASLPKIAFREQLSVKHGRDFTNHNDVKIGKEIFQMELEAAGVQCYNGRTPKQTIRSSIALKDCIPSWIKFDSSDFNRIKNWLAEQVITETKGTFTDLTAQVGGLTFVFGTGGIHASVENQHFIANDDMMILDVDVTSLYPSIAIANNYYPAHLGKQFVQVYRQLKEQRISFKKGTVENDALKLALNGVYGASNDRFSVFYDPKFTMDITIGGQLMMAMLAEQLLQIEKLKIISCNTDGITMWMPISIKWLVDGVCQQWEQITKLHLEQVEYSKMFIKDVNNYVAEYTDGTVKRKGAYEYETEWHQNASALVVPKVAEQVLLHGKPIRETVEQWPDRMDFMCRVKINHGSVLMGGDTLLENTQRYYVSKGGVRLFKIMPPLKDNPNYRRIGVVAGWDVCPCNDIKTATLPIDFEYYIDAVEKLTLALI